MMLTITTNSFENDVLRADKPVLVDFWAPGGVGHLEGSKGVLNELMTAEILLGVTLVDGHLAGAGDETDAGDGVLTTAGTLVDNGVLSHL